MKKKELKTLEEIEEYFAKQPKIYIKKEYSNYKDLAKDMACGKVPTFYKRGRQQAYPSSYRSLTDIIRTCKTYFNVSAKEVLLYLDTLNNTRNRCHVIRKYVFHHNEYPWGFQKTPGQLQVKTEIGDMRYGDLIKLCQE